MSTNVTAEQRKSRKISLEEFVDVLERCDVSERLDIGGSLIYKATHALYGAIVLVNTASMDQNAIIFLDTPA